MLRFDDSIITSHTLILGFDVQPNLILDYGREISQMANSIGAQVVQIPTAPQAPPNQPRLAIGNADMEIRFSLSQVEIATKISQNPIEPVGTENSWTKLEKSLIVLDKIRFIYSLNQQFVGMFSLIHSRQNTMKTPQEISAAIFEELVDYVPTKKPVSIGWQMGFLSEGNSHYINYNVKPYETKELKLEPDMMMGGPVRVDFSKYPTVDQGVEVVLDINNRPNQNKRSFKEEIAQIINLTKAEIETFKINGFSF